LRRINVTLVDDDIYSVLPDVSREHHYDRRAIVYGKFSTLNVGALSAGVDRLALPHPVCSGRVELIAFEK
jgi:hypothetical protein